VKSEQQPPAHPTLRRSRRCASRIVAGVTFALIVTDAACAQKGTDSWVLDEFVVTSQRESFQAAETAAATRTPTPIEKIPQSIQVLTRTLLGEQDLQTFSDALFR